MKNTFSKNLGGLALMLSLLMAASGQVANQPQLITTSSRSSATAAGDSMAPSFSADGRSLMFLSRANNLVTNDNNRPWLDLFVHRLDTGETILASPNQSGTGGSEADAESPCISSNGNQVAFVSYAHDMTDTYGANYQEKVFWRNLTTGQTRMVNLSLNNQIATTRHSRPAILSQDGRTVVFQSTMYGLEANALSTENTTYNFIYARDMQSNLIRQVGQSTNISGAVNYFGYQPAVSADGRLLAFLGYPSSPSSSPNRRVEVYCRDVEADTTTCISRLVERVWPEMAFITNRMHVYQATMSPNGRYFAFVTHWYTGELWYYDRLADTISLAATNVVSPNLILSPEATTYLGIVLSFDGQMAVHNNGTNLFAWDSRTGVNQQIDVGLDGMTPGNGVAIHPAVSTDGSKVVFVSNSTNFVPETAGLTNGSFQIYLRDLTLGITHLLTTNAQGQLNGDYSGCNPAINSDGTLVAFDSEDDSLVTNDFNHASDVFVKDLRTGEIRLISKALPSTASATPLGSVFGPSLSVSADGRYAAFTATDGEIAPGDTNGFRDAFVTDRQSGTTTLASIGADGTPGNLDVVDAIVSDDGRFVLFTSFSANLFSGEMPQVVSGINYLYLRDLQSNSTVLIASNEASSMPALSPDGRYVAFASRATNLVDQVVITNGGNYLNVYLHDVNNGTNILASLDQVRRDGGLGNSRNPRISPDSQWVVFDSAARGLDVESGIGGGQFLYLYNISSANLRLISANTNAATFPASFSMDSRKMVYRHASWGLNIYDMIAGTRLSINATNSGLVINPILNLDGTQVVYMATTNGAIYRLEHVDTANMRNVIIMPFFPEKPSEIPAPQISYDNASIVFQTRGNAVAADTNTFADVYLFDARQNNLILLTMSDSWLSGNSGSMLPTVSRDGRTLFFHTFAPDLVANDWNGGGDWVAMDLTSNLVESIARPIIARQPLSQTGMDGAALALDVGVTSGANVYYQWWKDGLLLTNGGRFTGAATATLRLAALAPGDAGGYSVVVSNVYGIQTSLVATLTVIHPPIALQSLALGAGTNGQQMTFGLQSLPGRTYQLLARPDLSTGQWQPEGLPLSATGEVLWFQFNLGTNRQRYYKVMGY